jgi:transposase
VGRVLTELGHEVIVAHAQKVRLIVKSRRKDDRLDARTLARLARIDPELLSPVQHRSAQAQLHLTEIRARAGPMSARTALVNAARGLVKSYGQRLRKCGMQQVRRETTSGLSAGLREALEPLLREVESLNERIQEYDRRIEKMAQETYPETALLKQVNGVGDLIATAYVLTIEDPHRFRKQSRRGMFCGVAAEAEELGRERATDAHQQRRRRVSADAAGAGGALHFRTLWRR